MNSSAKMVERGDILLALYGANSGDISISQMRGAINQAILCIRTNVAPVFFKSVWEKHAQKILNSFLQGGQGNLSADIVKKITISIPSRPEQAKIAALFSLIDERIAVQSKIIEQYQSLIRALYREMMPLNDVEVVSLGSLVKVSKGKQVNGDLLSDEGPFYVMNGGITPSGYFDEFNTPPETISISEGGNSCGYVQFNENPFWSGGHCYTLLEPKTNVVHYKFLFHYLKSHQDDIMALRIGSGLPNIQKKDIESYPVLLPRFEKQAQLAELFDGFCDIERIELNFRDLLCKQKQFLLASVLT